MMSKEKLTQSMLERTKSFDEYLIESLKNPEKATAYLQVALDEYQQDGDTEFFMMALRNVAQANGGVGQLAKKIDSNRQNLYHTLSHKGNPTLSTLTNILGGLGFHLSISPLSLPQHA